MTALTIIFVLFAWTVLSILAVALCGMAALGDQTRITDGALGVAGDSIERYWPRRAST